MGLKNISWPLVESGQIVNFVYKTKGEKRGMKRTVLIIHPDYKFIKKTTGRVKRYIIGLQLHVFGEQPIKKSELRRMLKRISGAVGEKTALEMKEGAIQANIPERFERNREDTARLYRKIKLLVGRTDVWRSYDRRECLKRRVYLETDYDRLPKRLVNELLESQTTQLQDKMEME